MSELTKESFDLICRVCTSNLNNSNNNIHNNNNNSKSIFDSFITTSKTLEFCLRTRIEKDDELPKFLCEPCSQKLQEFEDFRKLCYDNQILLRRCLDPENKEGNKLENGDYDHLDKAMSDEDDEGDGDAEATTKAKLPELNDPTLEDYVLMKEETFTLDPAQQSSILGDYLAEVNKNGAKKTSEDNKDRDLMEIQRLRKEILPPMWDVFEKAIVDTEGLIKVTRRRYIVAKNAFSCSLCGECFEFDQGKSRDDANEEKNKLYDCHVCGKVFPRRGSWKRHLSTHENIKPYVCRVCWSGFNRKDDLKEHLVTHGPSRPYSCDSCKKQFIRNEHLARHKLCSPACSPDLASPLFGIDVVRPFQCDVCNQGFVRKEHLVRHRKRAHDLDPPEGAEAKPFSCSVCHKTFTRREHLRRHQQIHARELLQSHADLAAISSLTDMTVLPNSLMPEIAMSTMTSGGELIKKEMDDTSESMDVDSDQTLNRTPIMNSPVMRNMTSPIIGSLSSPILRTPGSPIMSGIPTSVLAAVAHKDKIMRPTIPREKPPKPIPKCNICKKEFSRRSHLLRHMKRLHNIDPPPSNRGRNYLRPEDENHNNRQYECVTCGEGFTESEKLNQHMETHGNTIMNNFIWM